MNIQSSLWEQAEQQKRLRNEPKHYESGKTLRSDHKEKVAELIKGYYTILRIFGTVFFAMSSLGGVGFVVSFFTDEQWREGMFSMPFFRWFAFGLSALMIGGLMFGTYQMMMIYYKRAKRVESGDFEWRLGKISMLNQHHANRTSISLYCDGENCVPLGMMLSDFEQLYVGYELMVVKVCGVLFAYDPHRV